MSLEFFWKKYKQLFNSHRTKIIANIYWVIFPDTVLNRIYIYIYSLQLYDLGVVIAIIIPVYWHKEAYEC